MICTWRTERELVIDAMRDVHMATALDAAIAPKGVARGVVPGAGAVARFRHHDIPATAAASGDGLNRSALESGQVRTGDGVAWRPRSAAVQGGSAGRAGSSRARGAMEVPHGGRSIAT